MGIMVSNAKSSVRYIAILAMAVVIFGTVHACGVFGEKFEKVAPSNVSASAADQQVTLKWNSVSGADSYNIYWSAASGVTKSSGTKISGISNATYAHTSLANGTTYYYIVTAVNIVEEGDASSEVSATPQAPTVLPSAPTGVTATAGDAKVDISWNVVAGASTYNIYWSTASGVTTGSPDTITGITGATRTHPSLTNGTTYYYIVTAENSIGESAASAEVSASPAGGGGGGGGGGGSGGYGPIMP